VTEEVSITAGLSTQVEAEAASVVTAFIMTKEQYNTLKCGDELRYKNTIGFSYIVTGRNRNYGGQVLIAQKDTSNAWVQEIQDDEYENWRLVP
jgi:hypothetical protein